MTHLRTIRQPRLRWIVTAALLASMAGLVLSQIGAVDAAGSTTAGEAGAGAATSHGGSKPTVVLVHGAWADSGSWDQAGVRRRLPPGPGRDLRRAHRGPPGSCVGGDPTQVFDLRPIPGAPTGVMDAYVKQGLFPSCFANDLPARQAAVVAARRVQKLGCGRRPAGTVDAGSVL